jgi:hypothetical protein
MMMAANDPDNARREFPQTLVGAEIIFDMEDDDGEEFDEDDGDCAFCRGREAAQRGEGEDQNPFPKTDARKASIEWFESDYGLWLAGYGVGSHKPGDLPWFAQPDG